MTELNQTKAQRAGYDITGLKWEDGKLVGKSKKVKRMFIGEASAQVAHARLLIAQTTPEPLQRLLSACLSQAERIHHWQELEELEAVMLPRPRRSK